LALSGGPVCIDAASVSFGELGPERMNVTFHREVSVKIKEGMVLVTVDLIVREN